MLQMILVIFHKTLKKLLESKKQEKDYEKLYDK